MSLKHILSSLYNKERVSLTPHPPSVVRQKRSWGSFWGGLFDLGTQDELEKIKDHELAISNSELSLANSLRNITDVNTHLLNSLQTVSSSVDSLVSRKKNLFSDIHSIMDQKVLTIDKFNGVFKILDKTTSLISEYLTLQTQTTLLFH
jgi:hypothetical protein